MIYKCQYFKIHELVPPKVHKDRGERAWELLDDRLLFTLDRLRERYGRIAVNNWDWDGDRLWSGLRTPGSPYYNPYSQHTFGRAVDCLFNDVSVEDVRTDILINQNDFEYINAVELDVSWLHIDVRNCDRIKAFEP